MQHLHARKCFAKRKAALSLARSEPEQTTPGAPGGAEISIEQRRADLARLDQVDQRDAAARAIARLRDVRDELELAARAPGEFITITRQVQEQILNDIGIVARMVRELVERS